MSSITLFSFALLLLQSSAKSVLESAVDAENWIISHRRKLHQVPELEFDLPKTTAIVREALDSLGITYIYPVAKSGIVATIGQGSGPVVGLRADMDALPIREPTTLAFHSQMHACGHDAHTAMLLGAAKILKERERELNGKVKLVFQPCEEKAKGAKLMIESGHLDDIEAMFGFHIWPSFESGTVHTRSGAFFAAANRFSVTVTGHGGHASMPNLFTDPYIPVASMILAYQTIISRKTHPTDSNVLTVSVVHGGEVFNVVPSTVTFLGTMRSMQDGGLETMAESFTSITESISNAYGCQSEVFISDSTLPVINHPASTAFAVDVATKLFGEGVFGGIEPTMAAEDFSFFGVKMPATFMLLGIHNSSVGETGMLHTPELLIDESVLHRGAALHASLAIEFLRKPLEKDSGYQSPEDMKTEL